MENNNLIDKLIIIYNRFLDDEKYYRQRIYNHKSYNMVARILEDKQTLKDTIQKLKDIENE